MVVLALVASSRPGVNCESLTRDRSSGLEIRKSACGPTIRSWLGCAKSNPPPAVARRLEMISSLFAIVTHTSIPVSSPNFFPRPPRPQLHPGQRSEGPAGGDAGGGRQAPQARQQNKPLHFHHRRVSIDMLPVRLLLQGAACLAPHPGWQALSYANSGLAQIPILKKYGSPFLMKCGVSRWSTKHGIRACQDRGCRDSLGRCGRHKDQIKVFY